jgi:hypothetical protein
MAEETRYVVVNSKGERVTKKALIKEEAERESRTLNESLADPEKTSVKQVLLD